MINNVLCVLIHCCYGLWVHANSEHRSIILDLQHHLSAAKAGQAAVAALAAMAAMVAQAGHANQRLGAQS